MSDGRHQRFGTTALRASLTPASAERGTHKDSTSPSFFRAVGRLAQARDGKVAIAGILVIVLLVVQTGFGHSALQAAGLSRPTESFVELYFPDARTLPSTLPASRRLKIRFAVGYVGSRTHSFAWQVSERTDKVLASGHSIVTASRTDVVVQILRVDCSGKRTQLRISVEHSSARITLWLSCPSRR
jgi:hypothetical protein